MKRIAIARQGVALAAVFIVLLLCAGQSLAYNQGDPEYRTFWIDAWHAGALNQTQVNTLLGVVGSATNRGVLRDANCNAVILQVRRNCDVMYPSRMGEPYMSGLSPSNFNGLQAVINAAHDTTGGKKRIEVVACIVTFRTSGGTVYLRHDDTPTGSLTNLDNYWPSLDDTGAVVSDKAFDPGHPLVEEYTVNVAMDLVNNYDIDGIQFDYIRFTANNQGYNPTSVARYNARYGLSGQPAATNEQWKQWRRDQVTAVVRKIYAKIQAVKPWVKQSASVVTWNPAPTASTRAGFQATRPYYDVYSDWDSWLQEGILDAAFPMTYYDYASNASDYTKWMNFEKDRHGNRHMYIGPGIYLNSLSNAITEIQATRNASPAGHTAEGWCGFSYATPYVGGNWGTFSSSLVSSVTQTWADIPSMPWKTTPTKGHISGTVTYSSNGAWADGADVILSGPEGRSMKCDGTGFYAFIDLTPGTYTVTARKTGYPNSVKVVTVALGSVTGNMYVLDFQLGTTPGPVISNVQAAGVTDSSANITWNTDLASSSQVHYGLTTSYGLATAVNSSLVTAHSQPLTGLLPSTKYHYRVLSGSSVSGDYTFTTYGPSVISNIQATALTTTSATITWDTTAPSDSTVAYGTTTTYGSQASDGNHVTSHSVVLSGLSASTTYHIQCTSANGYGADTSDDFTFSTPALVTEVIVDNSDPGWSNTSPAGNEWTVGTLSGPKVGADYLYYAGDGSLVESSVTRKCKWTPTLAADGYYDVYVYYQIGTNRNSAAPFTVHYYNGQVTSVQNQYGSSTLSGWYKIGDNLPFLVGSPGDVEVTTLSTDTKLVSADAAKWVYKSALDLTPPGISMSAPSASETKAGPITYTIYYSGADTVTLAADDVTLNKTGTANGTVTVTGSGNSTRTLTISGITGDGTIGVSIASGTAADNAGNGAPALGSGAAFAVDNTVPAISSVSLTPSMAAVGDPVHMIVHATDNRELSSVVVNGTELTRMGGDTWAGDIGAAGPLGIKVVRVVANDSVGNSTTHQSSTYKTVGVVAALASSSMYPQMMAASGQFLFKFWGKVSEVNDEYFTLADGSGQTVTVHAPGYKAKVGEGDNASARGILTSAGWIESELALIVSY